MTIIRVMIKMRTSRKNSNDDIRGHEDIGRNEVDVDENDEHTDESQHIDENDDGNVDRVENEVQIPPLPYLALRRIIFHSIRSSPLMRYTLRMVNVEFANIVREYGYPMIYIRPSQIIDLPSTISVNRLVRIYGSHSGLMLNVRNLLRVSRGRWYRAWLTLYGIRRSFRRCTYFLFFVYLLFIKK